MDPEALLQCPQYPAICPCLEPDQSSPRSFATYSKRILVLSSHLNLDPPSVFICSLQTVRRNAPDYFFKILSDFGKTFCTLLVYAGLVHRNCRNFKMLNRAVTFAVLKRGGACRKQLSGTSASSVVNRIFRNVKM